MIARFFNESLGFLQGPQITITTHFFEQKNHKERNMLHQFGVHQTLSIHLDYPKQERFLFLGLF